MYWRRCKEGLHDIISTIWELWQEGYQKAGHDTYRRKDPDEDFALPEIGLASEEEIAEAERKILGQGDSARYKLHIIPLRGYSRGLREIQDALNSIKQ